MNKIIKLSFTKAALAASLIFFAFLASAQSTVTLTSSTGEITLTDGQTLTGTGGADTHVTIDDGATVTLDNVSITSVDESSTSHSWAGITCSGDATIILASGSTNTIYGCNVDNAGIYIQTNYTLIIEGDGTLIAKSKNGAGIGGKYKTSCGNIIIKGGTITATSENYSAGIGAGDGSSSEKSTCGDITIMGGIINAKGGPCAAGIGSGHEYSTCGNILICGGTVNATGGTDAAGIGSGLGTNSVNKSSKCGDITIIGGKITATRGSKYANTIGSGCNGSCGTVTIAGVEGAITTSPYTVDIVPATYSVIFNVNGGTGSVSNQTINVGITTPLTKNSFTREGYYFIGWSNTADGDVYYANGQSVTDLVASDGFKTLYAKWVSKENLPAGIQVDADYLENQTGFYYVNMPINAATTTVNINDLKYFPFKIYDDGGKNKNATKDKGYLTIYPPSGYIVKLTGNVLAKKMEYDALLTVYDGDNSNAPQLGLFNSSNTITVSSTGSSITLFFNNGEKDVKGLELTATTSTINYSITYNGIEGATFATANPTSYTVENNDIMLVNPTKDGYTFLGWTYDGQTEPVETATIPKGSYGDTEFTANWAKILNDANVAEIPDQTYNGSAIDPEVTVTDGETTLVKGVDYTVTYSNNTNAGTSAKATITGKGNYAGTVEKTFIINPLVTISGALTLTEDQNGITAEIGGDYNGSDVAYSLESDIENVSVIFTRPFTAGVTSTIVLPFDIEAGDYSGGDFYEFSDIDTKTWTATMSKVTSVTAHTPYLFVPSGESLTISQKVTLKAASSTTAATTAQNGWTFTGVYQKKVWGGDDGGNKDYCFAANSTSDGVNPGDFVKIGTYVQVRAFRCYLTNSTLAKSKTDLPEKITIRLIDETSSVVNPDDPDPLNPEDSGDITTPVSEITPNSGTKVWSYDRTIFIEAQSSTDYQIIDLSGRTLLSGTTNSTREEITLNRTVGIVIVKIGGKTFKVNY